MSASQQSMVQRVASRFKVSYDEQLRRGAYNIASTLEDEKSVSALTRKLASVYYNAVNRSKPEAERAKAAADLHEQLRAEADFAQQQAVLMRKWEDLFKRAEKEHARAPWPPVVSPPGR